MTKVIVLACGLVSVLVGIQGGARVFNLSYQVLDLVLPGCIHYASIIEDEKGNLQDKLYFLFESPLRFILSPTYQSC